MATRKGIRGEVIRFGCIFDTTAVTRFTLRVFVIPIVLFYLLLAQLLVMLFPRITLLVPAPSARTPFPATGGVSRNICKDTLLKRRRSIRSALKIPCIAAETPLRSRLSGAGPSALRKGVRM